MSKYVIYKATRVPADISYSGPTWDSAGIRNRYKAVYDDIDDALDIVKVLNQYNPVGFKVAPVAQR